jgi:PAS domain S-box-containing protein
MSNHALYFDQISECIEQLKQYDGSVAEQDKAAFAGTLSTLSGVLREFEQTDGKLHTQHVELMAAYRAGEINRRRYQALFELTPDGYLITDTSTIVQEANSAATNLLRTSRDSLVGKALTEFVVNGDYPGFSQWLNQWPTWSQLQEQEAHIQPSAGAPFPASLIVATISDAEGEVVGLRWLLRDISERKRVEEERAQLAAIVQSSSDAIVGRNLDGIIQSWNTGAENLYGYTADEVKGKPISILFLPDNRDEEAIIMEKVSQGESVDHVETVRLGKGGRKLHISLTVSPIRDDNGTIIGASGIARDIGERKRMEAAEREQTVLAEALRDSATALNSTLNLSEVLDRILANVSRVVPHDAAEIMLNEAGTARVVRTRGYDERGLTEMMMALRLSVNDTPTLRQMIETMRPVVIPDTRTYPGWVNLIEEEWLHSYAGVPILFQGEIVGFINLVSAKAGFFTLAHAERLQAFAEQAAIALHNAQMYEQAHELAAVRERERLARDLHDAVSQILFSSSIIAEALTRLWKRDPERLGSYLMQLNRLNRGALAEMRNLLIELRPTKLLEVEIDDLLTQLVEAVMGRSRIAVSLAMEGLPSLPPDVRIAFYRIAQEALNNVIKHAQATQISVYFGKQGGQTELHLKDNGTGFDPNQIPSTGMGLSIMHERARSVGASLRIISEAGNGTEIILLWPVGAGGTNGTSKSYSGHDC